MFSHTIATLAVVSLLAACSADSSGDSASPPGSSQPPSMPTSAATVETAESPDPDQVFAAASQVLMVKGMTRAGDLIGRVIKNTKRYGPSVSAIDAAFVASAFGKLATKVENLPEAAPSELAQKTLETLRLCDSAWARDAQALTSATAAALRAGTRHVNACTDQIDDLMSELQATMG